MKNVNVNNKSISYYACGNGFPIIFGHSYLWNQSMWQPQVDFFSARGYRCIVPELPGHGNSSVIKDVDEIYPLDDLTADMWQFLQQLEVNEFVVVGLSVGGMWGADMALKHPDAVKGLVIADSFVGAEPEESQAEYFNLLNAFAATNKFTSELIEAVTPYFFCENTFTHNPQLVSHFKQLLANVPSSKIASIVAIGKGIFTRKSLLPKLAEIRVPVQVIVGAEDKPRPPHEAKIMMQALKTAVYLEIENAGHIANLEQSLVFNEGVANYLDQVLR